MLYNTDGCHGKFLKYQIQVKNEIVLIPPISGSLWREAEEEEEKREAEEWREEEEAHHAEVGGELDAPQLGHHGRPQVPHHHEEGDRRAGEVAYDPHWGFPNST